MNKKLSAVIFDMDGLMIESEHLQSKSFEKIFLAHGIKPKYNKSGLIQTVGITAKDNLIKLKKIHDFSASAEELLVLKNEIYSEILDEGIEPMPGLHRLIKSLKTDNIKIAVASSSIRLDIDKVLNQLNLNGSFNAVVSGAEVKYSKPAPDVFLKAAEQMEVPANECIVLEDAEAGIKAGNSAGMCVIAIPSRYTLEHDFSLANHVFKSLSLLSASKLKKLLNGTI